MAIRQFNYNEPSLQDGVLVITNKQKGTASADNNEICALHQEAAEYKERLVPSAVYMYYLRNAGLSDRGPFAPINTIKPTRSRNSPTP